MVILAGEAQRYNSCDGYYRWESVIPQDEYLPKIVDRHRDGGCPREGNHQRNVDLLVFVKVIVMVNVSHQCHIIFQKRVYVFIEK